MAATVTPDAIQLILADPSPNSSSPVPEIIVQVTELKPVGSKHMFWANDGKRKIRAFLASDLSSEVMSGKIHNFGLIRMIEYIANTISGSKEKSLIVAKCEPVFPSLDSEYKVDENGMLVEPTKEVSKSEVRNDTSGTVLKPKQEIVANSTAQIVQDEVSKSEVRNDVSGIIMKPKKEIVAKSAAQIVQEQRINQAPAARLAMTRRVQPLVSLNPYQGKWTIKVRVTSKGEMRYYKNNKGGGSVFNVELTDEDGTQIRATMFNGAATKFFDRFQIGKVYFISNGMLKVANKQYRTVENDYELTLNENSEVDEASDEQAFIPETKFKFRKIDELGPYVNRRELVDVIGVIQNVSPTMSVRRKSNDESISKRDITIADQTKTSVTVSLWGDLATKEGQDLLDKAKESPVVAIKSLKVGDYQGVSLSTVSKSTIVVNPDIQEAKDLRLWFDLEGKETSMSSISSSPPGGAQLMYANRVSLIHILNNPSLGEGKMEFFSIKAFIKSINADQPMWYRACTKCNKKVVESTESEYRCENCQVDNVESSLRYIMNVKIGDSTSEAFVSVFNEQAQRIIGCSADELNELRSNDAFEFGLRLKDVAWNSLLLRVGVTQNEYNGEKRQRITVRAVEPVDYVIEGNFLAEDISKMEVSE